MANAMASSSSSTPTMKNGSSGSRHVPLNHCASGVLYEWKTNRPQPPPKKSTHTGMSVSLPAVALLCEAPAVCALLRSQTHLKRRM